MMKIYIFTILFFWSAVSDIFAVEVDLKPTTIRYRIESEIRPSKGFYSKKELLESKNFKKLQIEIKKAEYKILLFYFVFFYMFLLLKE